MEHREMLPPMYVYIYMNQPLLLHYKLTRWTLVQINLHSEVSQ